MGKPSGDDEIREIRKQLTLLVRALESMPQQGEDVGGHTSGICVDTYMTETELMFQIDMPGVDQENLKVRVSRENLTIEGTRVRPAADSSKTFIMAERPFGPFKRVLDLPTTVDTSKAEATLQNGMLVIQMPRMAERRGRERDVPVQRLDD